MADISDVTHKLAQMTDAAVYPNGDTQPSITGKLVTIFEGWPEPSDLDAAAKAGSSMVSIFPTSSGSSGALFQLLNNDYVIIPAVHGMAIGSVDNGAVTVTGTPGVGEYVTVIADGQHSYSRTGPDLQTILSLIATDAIGTYPSVSVFTGGIQFPTTRLSAHVGAPATKGRVTHRQKASIAVTTWSPNNADRNTIAAAVDAALKAVNRITFPDTSQGILTYERMIQVDRGQSAGVYSRDLMFSCEYATLFTYQAFEITSVGVTQDAGPITSFVAG